MTTIETTTEHVRGVWRGAVALAREQAAETRHPALCRVTYYAIDGLVANVEHGGGPDPGEMNEDIARLAEVLAISSRLGQGGREPPRAVESTPSRGRPPLRRGSLRV